MELLIDHITKQYGNKIAVNDFSAVITDGVYALLGANGAGKTTLLRMICDILRPSRGEISLDGIPIKSLGEEYRQILGYLPQSFGYYPNFTGWDFMMYFAALKGLPRFTAQERCRELLELTGLYSVRRKKLKTYSGGMRQRIGIAQALINDPKILVLDEPTAGLDPKERAKFRNIISNLSADRIVLLSTHIVSDVEYIADQIMIMKNGALALQGDRDHICDPIQGMVWTCYIQPEDVDEVSAMYVVSSLRHMEDMVEMRIVSQAKPFENAIPAAPNLEDLYLYYFREVEQ